MRRRTAESAENAETFAKVSQRSLGFLRFFVVPGPTDSHLSGISRTTVGYDWPVVVLFRGMVTSLQGEGCGMSDTGIKVSLSDGPFDKNGVIRFAIRSASERIR